MLISMDSLKLIFHNVNYAALGCKRKVVMSCFSKVEMSPINVREVFHSNNQGGINEGAVRYRLVTSRPRIFSLEFHSTEYLGRIFTLLFQGIFPVSLYLSSL